MSDFLDSLVQRSLGTEPTLLPRLPSRFEPMKSGPAFGEAAGEQFGTSNDIAPSRNLDAASQTSSDMPTGQLVSGGAPLFETRVSSHTSPTASPSGPSIDTTPQRQFPHYGEFNTSDRPGTDGPAAVERFDARDHGWLNRRMDEMSIQLRQLRGEQADSRVVAPVVLGPQTERQLSLPTPDSEPDDSSILPLQAREQFSSEEPALTTHFLPRAGSEPRSSASENLLRPESRDEFLSPQAELRVQQVVKIVPEVQSVAPRVLPRTESHSPSRASLKSPRRESRDELLSLLAESQMQPVPKIVPEELPSISKHSAPPQPTINVTIGRVEVKATREAAPKQRQTQPQTQSSVMSLQDYLQQRAAGGLP